MSRQVYGGFKMKLVKFLLIAAMGVALVACSKKEETKPAAPTAPTKTEAPAAPAAPAAEQPK